jgi:hypothetical protein
MEGSGQATKKHFSLVLSFLLWKKKRTPPGGQLQTLEATPKALLALSFFLPLFQSIFIATIRIEDNIEYSLWLQ